MMNISRVFRFTLIILISVTVSCSKKTDPVIVQPCAVTKITVTTSSNGGTAFVYTTDFTYNSDLTLAQASQVYTYTVSGVTNSITTVTKYTYNGGILASTSSGDAQATWTSLNGAVTKISGSTGTGVSTVLVTENFTYDSQGKLSSIVYQDNLGAGNKITNNFTFDASSNLQNSKREVILGGVSQGGIMTTTYSAFDGKNNPYALLAKAIKQPYFSSGVFGDTNEMFYSKNNIVGLSLQGGFVTTSTFEYNDANYPTKIVQTSLGTTTTYLYEYQACK